MLQITDGERSPNASGKVMWLNVKISEDQGTALRCPWSRLQQLNVCDLGMLQIVLQSQRQCTSSALIQYVDG
jgi:hypothetical protein